MSRRGWALFIVMGLIWTLPGFPGDHRAGRGRGGELRLGPPRCPLTWPSAHATRIWAGSRRDLRS